MTVTFNVPDMTCGHCVKTITDAIQGRYADAVVQADVDTHTLTVRGAQAEAAQLEQLIKDEGYTPSLA